MEKQELPEAAQSTYPTYPPPAYPYAGPPTGHHAQQQPQPQPQPPPYGNPVASGYSQPMQGYPMNYGYPPAIQQQSTTNVVVSQPAASSTILMTPPDYMTQAILVTLFCFWPTGIVAIMRASDARAAAQRGDFSSAVHLGSSAKSMINLTIGLGIASIVIIVIILGVYVGAVRSTIY